MLNHPWRNRGLNGSCNMYLYSSNFTARGNKKPTASNALFEWFLVQKWSWHIVSKYTDTIINLPAIYVINIIVWIEAESECPLNYYISYDNLQYLLSCLVIDCRLKLIRVEVCVNKAIWMSRLSLYVIGSWKWYEY